LRPFTAKKTNMKRLSVPDEEEERDPAIPTEGQKDYFSQLNRDVLFTILLQGLSLKDVSAVCNSNKVLQNFCKQRGVWERLFIERFGSAGGALDRWRYERDTLGMTNGIAHLMGYMHEQRYSDESVFPRRSSMWMDKTVVIVLLSEIQFDVRRAIWTLRSSMAELLPHLKFMENIIDLEKSIKPNTIFFYNDSHRLSLKKSVALHQMFYYLLIAGFKVFIPDIWGGYTPGRTILQ
jgi:hypothetical protein